jgi:hypothetical protein
VKNSQVSSEVVSTLENKGRVSSGTWILATDVSFQCPLFLMNKSSVVVKIPLSPKGLDTTSWDITVPRISIVIHVMICIMKASTG